MPTDDRPNGHNYEIPSYWYKLVADYLGISVLEVPNLNLIDYLRFRRDAFILKMEQTEEGREYLDLAWQLEQTKADREALRKKNGYVRKERKTNA